MSATERRSAALTTKLNPDFGPWIRRTRQGMKLTVLQFAELCDLNSGTVTNFELSRRAEGAFQIEAFVRLAKGLDMDLGYVLHKAGFDLGPDGVNLTALRRVEVVAEDFAEHHAQVRVALAEAIREFERSGLQDDRLVLELGRGLAALDRLGERLRREGFAAGKRPREDAQGLTRPWNAADVAFLRNHPELSHEDAADLLGRTADAVRAQRQRNDKKLNGGRR